MFLNIFEFARNQKLTNRILNKVTRENAPDLPIKRFNEREDRIGDFRCTRLLYEHFNIYMIIIRMKLN